MENNLKVLFVKQAYDNLGPKSSYGWSDDISAEGLLKHFCGKTSLFETLLYYKSDFLIVPTPFGSPWLNTLLQLPQYKEFIESTTKNVLNPTDVNFGDYDVVITHDPILGPWMDELKKKFKNTVFAYIMVEHTSWQMHGEGFKYDLWLDHTMGSTNDMVRIPQAINYMFPRVPEVVQSMFKEDSPSIFIDYRSYGHFISKGKSNVALTGSDITNFNRLNFTKLKLPLETISETSLKPYMFVTNSADSIDYYKKLNRAKYYVTIANRVGQAAFDAASMGCLVIGNSKSKLHNLICHKDCLMSGDFTQSDVIKLIDKIESDGNYYNKLITHQNEMLQKWAIDYPMDMLKSAVKLKREGNE